MIFNGFEFTVSLHDAKKRGWFRGDVVEFVVHIGLAYRLLPVIWFSRGSQ
jgi:hypothetical protein